MTNEDPKGGHGVTRRQPRQGVGGSPVGSTLSIVLAVIAVVAGFLILRNITDDDGGDTGAEASADSVVTSSTIDSAVGTTAAATTTTVFVPVTDGATVVVANANTIGGSAGRMSTALEAEGFTMGTPINATETIDESVVYYDNSVAAAQAVAESVGVVMGGLTVEPVPTPPPTDDGTMGDGSVLVMLGSNQADKTIAELSGEGADAATTGTSPDPSGSAVGTAAAPESTTAG